MVPTRLRSAHRATVEEGLPALNVEMARSDITTPRRVAAFLATIGHESYFEYNIPQAGATGRYKGRGYIQLTGSVNYEAAGHYLGVDLITNPDLALSIDWSAKIATWYWTQARPKCSTYADNLQMGKINAAIGYQIGDGKEDARRCAAFAAALKHLTGVVPSGITCTR